VYDDFVSRRLSAEAGTTMRYVLHEMRTPLTQIMGFSEMLQEEVRERGQDDLAPDLEQIRSSAQELLDFVERVFRPDAPAISDAGDPVAEPAPEGTEDSTLPTASPLEPGPASGSLLVVDDEPKNRELLARRLSKRGYDVATAADGREALHAIEAGSFDLVLLDVLMPGTSGLEVLATVRQTRSAAELPVIMATALGASQDTVEALERGANDYVTKPFDFPVLLARVATQLSLRRATQAIAGLAQQLEIRNTFIRRTFGRYVSDEVVTSLLDNPTGLELRGEKRHVTILMSDLRGFSTLTESLMPTQVVSLLNGYLGTMAEVIQSHGGTIDELQGDGILAFFGAPLSQGDDAERAVSAAVAMQVAIEGLNERNRSAGLPVIEMGIGIATGEVIVGNLGSERRAKYGAVGSTVNLAARIESYCLGGEVLIEDETRDAVGEALRFDGTREVHPKGSAAPMRIHRVTAVRDVVLPEKSEALSELAAPIPVRFAFVEGKDVGGQTFGGEFSAVSASGARLRSDVALPEMSDLRIELLDPRGEPLPGSFYAKVVAREAGLVRFTTRSPSLVAALERVLESADAGGS
jgi:class 3 adenylate cyclase